MEDGDIEENTSWVEFLGEFRRVEEVEEEKGEGDDERKTPTDGINQRYNEEVLHFNLLSQMSLFNNQAGLSFA